MDQELKQRLIGAIVITALAAIFVPMLFDDPIDESGHIVNELAIPDTPIKSFENTASQLPAAGNEMGEEVASVEGSSADAAEFEAGRYGDEPIEDEGFEPEPFVEEPIYEAEAEPEPAKTKASIEPEPALPPSASKTEPPIKLQNVKSDAKVHDFDPGRSGWYIQLGSFSQQKNAVALRDTLRSQGFPAVVDEVSVEGVKSYRLIVGPEQNKSAAQAMQARLKRRNHTKSLLIAVGQVAVEKQDAPIAKANSVTEARSVAKSTTGSPPAKPEMVRWYIQLGSFSKRENAFSLRDKLRLQGFPVFVDEVMTTNGRSFRLRAGPELDKKRAEAMQAKLVKQNQLKSLLVSE